MLRLFVKYRNNHSEISYNYGAQQITGASSITNIGIGDKNSFCKEEYEIKTVFTLLEMPRVQ